MGEIVFPTDLTFEEAHESVERAKRGLEAAADEIVRQINGRAWLAFGCASWDEMREKVYAGAAVIVPRADQPQLMARLRNEGLSQREIGDTLGVHESTVSRNLQTQDTTPTRIDSLGRERPTSYAPVVEQKTRDLADVLEERMPGTRADLARGDLRARWSKDMARAADIDLLDPTDVRSVLDDTEARLAINTLRGLAKWADRLDQAGKPGLRIVGEADA